MISLMQDPKQRYYYRLLSDDNKRLYDTILSAWLKMDKDVTLPPCSASDIHRIVDYIRLDIPDLFYVDFTKGCSLSAGKKKIVLAVEFIYKEAQIEAIRQQVEAAIAKFVDKCAIKSISSKWERELAAHDYLAGTTKYRKEKSPNSHTIIGALLDGYAVCEGYAKAFKLLCDRTGILAAIVSGIGYGGTSDNDEPESHAWNIVKIGAEYAHVDVTWDSTISTSSDIFHDYFNLKDEEIMKDHEWDRTLLPKCASDSLGYYHRKGSIITGRRGFEQCIMQQIKSGNPSFQVKFNRDFRDGEEIAKLVVSILRKVPALKARQTYGATVRYNDKQRVASITIT